MAQTIDLVRDSTVNQLVSAMNQSNALKAAELAGTSGADVYDAFYAASVTPENIDSMFISWWKGADNGNYTRTQLLARWFNLLNDDKTYGVRFYKFGVSQTTNGELINDSAALGAATPSTDAVTGNDPYCKQFAFWAVEVNYEIDSNGEIDIKAVDKVDATFSRSGSAGMVGVAQKTGWFSYAEDNSYITKRYRACRKAGFIPLPEGVSPVDNDVRPFIVHAKYMGGLDSAGIPTSATKLPPMNYSYSHNSQITAWRKRGANYAGMSICDVNFRLLMFQLKYGKKGNSGTMEGCTSYNYQYTAAISENGVERILLTTAQAANLCIGSNIIIGNKGTGTSTDRNVASMYSICKNKRIASIVEVVVDGTTYAAVNIENDGTTFNTVAGETYISTMPWWSGACDDVLGVDGSPVSNTNGRYPFIIQGLECQNGAYAVVADVIDVHTIDGDNFLLTPNIVRKAANISTSVTANYLASKKPLVFNPLTTSWAWHYIGDLGYDSELPESVNPSVVDNGANSGNGYRAAVSVPAAAAGSFELLVWSHLYDGGSCGLTCSARHNGLGNGNWGIDAGASGSGANRGEWAG